MYPTPSVVMREPSNTPDLIVVLSNYKKYNSVISGILKSLLYKTVLFYSRYYYSELNEIKAMLLNSSHFEFS